jgi:putative transposase
MRTIKRLTVDLNLIKLNRLKPIAIAYAKEKQYWLNVFQKKENLREIKLSRRIRDRAVKAKYRSPYGLQARMWKLALQDAAETMDKYWQSLIEKIRKNIYRNKALTDPQKHYAYWVLKDYRKLQSVLSFLQPEFKELPLLERKRVVNYLNRQIKKYKKTLPRVKIVRSFCLDEDCYHTFLHKERQYISIMTQEPRKRLILPLSGNAPIKGNIRLVIENHRAQIHMTSEMKKKNIRGTNIIAVDFGYSEVITDSEGERYGESFGDILTSASDLLKLKMQRRHQLHALKKKYEHSHDAKKLLKAKKIKKMNLGRKKLDAHQRKVQGALATTINTAFNELLNKKPGILITEDLSHVFSYHKGKNTNRRLSSWTRGLLQDRLKFKTLVKGFDHKQVNAAYSSQMCPSCGFVGQKNRHGDKFQCQNCRHVGDADVIAAQNLKGRYFDQEITRYMSYREVKRILLERFHRQLETEQSGTVFGRIPDTTCNEPTYCGQSESHYLTQ